MLSRFYGYGKGFDVFDDSFRQFSPKGMRLWIRTRPKSPDSLMAKALRKVRLILKPILTRVSQGHIINAAEITSKSMLWLAANVKPQLGKEVPMNLVNIYKVRNKIAQVIPIAFRAISGEEREYS